MPSASQLKCALKYSNFIGSEWRASLHLKLRFGFPEDEGKKITWNLSTIGFAGITLQYTKVQLITTSLCQKIFAFSKRQIFRNINRRRKTLTFQYESTSPQFERKTSVVLPKEVSFWWNCGAASVGEYNRVI